MIVVPGTEFPIPAVQLTPRWVVVHELNPWRGTYITVRLTGTVHAIRVHCNGGWTHAGRRYAGTHRMSEWFGIGDFYLGSRALVTSLALPPIKETPWDKRSMFTHVDAAELLAGTVMNVGRAAALGGQPGGGAQAEVLFGPEPMLTRLGHWAPAGAHS